MSKSYLSIGLGLFGSGGLGPAQAWILKNCRASIGPDVGAKSRFSVNDKVFAKKTPCRIYRTVASEWL